MPGRLLLQRLNNLMSFPIELNQEQQTIIKQWATDDLLWENATHETLEINLRIFTRAILKAGDMACPNCAKLDMQVEVTTKINDCISKAIVCNYCGHRRPL